MEDQFFANFTFTQVSWSKKLDPTTPVEPSHRSFSAFFFFFCGEGSLLQTQRTIKGCPLFFPSLGICEESDDDLLRIYRETLIKGTRNLLASGPLRINLKWTLTLRSWFGDLNPCLAVWIDLPIHTSKPSIRLQPKLFQGSGKQSLVVQRRRGSLDFPVRSCSIYWRAVGIATFGGSTREISRGPDSWLPHGSQPMPPLGR